MTDKLNLIVIQIDSLNRHFLACYGNDWVKAPNLADFARRATVFDQHFVGSLPCMPARREIWAGSEEHWWRGWGPLEPWDRPIAHLAGRQGITSALITDHYHFFEWGSHSYYYDYSGYEFIRGHEFDNWRSEPVEELPDWATRMVERRGAETLIYVRNVQDFRGEEDFFGPRVMQTTSEWLDRNHKQEQFYLHVDCFDVHEPFHIPEPYRSMYTTDDYRRYSPWPHYGRIDRGPAALEPAEVEWVRAQFAGKLSMVDVWLGHVLDRLERHRLLERTCVIITTDHGHYLGEHGWMGKPGAPLYHTLCHIPLLVWHPGATRSGGRINAISQTVDLYATALEVLGLPVPEEPFVHSRSLLPLLAGQRQRHRDYAVYGYHNDRVGISTDEWTLLRGHDPQAGPGYSYSLQPEQLGGFGFKQRTERSFTLPEMQAGRFIPGVPGQVWRIPRQEWRQAAGPDLLFHNPSDPGQEHSQAEQRPEVVGQLEGLLRQHAVSLGAPEEQLGRLHL